MRFVPGDPLGIQEWERLGAALSFRMTERPGWKRSCFLRYRVYIFSEEDLLQIIECPIVAISHLPELVLI